MKPCSAAWFHFFLFLKWNYQFVFHSFIVLLLGGQFFLFRFLLWNFFGRIFGLRKGLLREGVLRHIELEAEILYRKFFN